MGGLRRQETPVRFFGGRDDGEQCYNHSPERRQTPRARETDFRAREQVVVKEVLGADGTSQKKERKCVGLLSVWTRGLGGWWCHHTDRVGSENRAMGTDGKLSLDP